MKKPSVTVPSIIAAKNKRQLVALTAYDYTMARLVDLAGIDIILVGDSLATVIQGRDNTLSVTVDEVIYHSKCVTRGVERALVVADLPFMSYQISPEEALRNAGHIMKETNVAAVKLEGAYLDQIQALVKADIPVMGHVGLTPQSYHRMGGHKIQGKEKLRTKAEQAGSPEAILEAALAIEEAGAFALVIEGVPEDLAKVITDKLEIPTIGIAAGKHCDGQILVSTDLLGMNSSTQPKFVRPVIDLESQIIDAFQNYSEEVVSTKQAKVVAGLKTTQLN